MQAQGVNIALAFTAVCVTLASPKVATATPQDLFGYGARTTGLAMTGVSYADNYEAVYANPAGLARARRFGLHLGYHGARYNLRIDGSRQNLETVQGLSIGFQIPLPFGGPLEDRLVFGGGFFTPSAAVLDTNAPFAEVSQFPVLARGQVVAIQLGFGIDLHGLVDGLRLGLGISGLADVTGRLQIALNEANRFVAETETQLLAGFAAIVGVAYDAEHFGAGLVYRGELDTEIDLDIEITNLPVFLPTITLDALAQYDPHLIAAEGYWAPNDDWRLIAHATVRFWGRWPGALSKTSETSNLPPDPHFRTTVSPRIAIERTFRTNRLQIDVRGGYAFEPTPAPPARLATARDSEGQPRVEDGMTVLTPNRLIDNHRHLITAGFGLDWQVSDDVHLMLDGYGQLHALMPRTHEIPEEGASENMRSTGWIFNGGVTLGAEW